MKKILTLTLLSLLVFSCTKQAHLAINTENKNVLEKLVDKNGPSIDRVEDVLLKNAKAAEKAGNYKKAVSFYQQFINTNKDADDEHILSFGKVLRRAGRYKQSIKIFDVLLEDNPKNIDALEGKALALLAQNKTKKAEKMFGKVMDLDASRWKTANGLGTIYTMQQKSKEALEYYELASSLTNDSNSTILTNIGLTHAFKKDYKKAIKYLKNASKEANKKDKTQVDLNLSMIYGLSGDMEKAAQVARLHLPEVAVLNNLGIFAEMSNNDKMARSYLNMALSRSPVHYSKAAKNLKELN